MDRSGLEEAVDEQRPKIAAATFIDRQVVDVSQAQAIADTYGIGPGESEAIVVAQSASSPTLLLDDELARAAAVALNIPRIGSIGILLLAKARGHIDMVRPRIDGLLAHGTHLSKKLVDEALRRAGE